MFQVPSFADCLIDGGLVLRRPQDGDAEALLSTVSDERVWAWMPTKRPMSAADMQEIIDRWESNRSTGKRVAYVVELDGVVAGNTSLYDFDVDNNSVESGWTWFDPDRWGSRLNMRTKLLLYGYAFDQLGVGRLAVRTDILNLPAQRALARLGLHKEGVLRKHLRRPDGSMRDSVYYSVIDEEWPELSNRWRNELDTGVRPRRS